MWVCEVGLSMCVCVFVCVRVCVCVQLVAAVIMGTEVGVLQCVAVCCSVCAAVCCIVLQCVAVSMCDWLHRSRRWHNGQFESKDKRQATARTSVREWKDKGIGKTRESV